MNYIITEINIIVILFKEFIRNFTVLIIFEVPFIAKATLFYCSFLLVVISIGN